MKAKHRSYKFISLDQQINAMTGLLSEWHICYRKFTCLAVKRYTRNMLISQEFYIEDADTAARAIELHYQEFVTSLGLPKWWNSEKAHYRERRRMLRRFRRYLQGQKLLARGYVSYV